MLQTTNFNFKQPITTLKNQQKKDINKFDKKNNFNKNLTK